MKRERFEEKISIKECKKKKTEKNNQERKDF